MDTMLLSKAAEGALSGLTRMAFKPQRLGSVAPIVGKVVGPAGQGLNAVKLRGGGVVQAARNPTLNMASQSQKVWGTLPRHVQDMVHNSDPVKKWGVMPHAVLDIAHGSKAPGETLVESLTRNILHNGARPAAAVAAPADAATRVAKLAASNYMLFFRDAMEKMSVDMSPPEKKPDVYHEVAKRLAVESTKKNSAHIKEAVSTEWVKKMVGRAAGKAPDARIAKAIHGTDIPIHRSLNPRPGAAPYDASKRIAFRDAADGVRQSRREARAEEIVRKFDAEWAANNAAKNVAKASGKPRGVVQTAVKDTGPTHASGLAKPVAVGAAGIGLAGAGAHALRSEKSTKDKKASAEDAEIQITEADKQRVLRGEPPLWGSRGNIAGALLGGAAGIATTAKYLPRANTPLAGALIGGLPVAVGGIGGAFLGHQLERMGRHAVGSSSKDKEASVAGSLGKSLQGKGGALKRVGEHLMAHDHAYDLGGLGILAAPSVGNVVEAIGHKRQGKAIDKKELWHSGAELAGLGTLAAPVAAHMLTGH